MDYEKKNPIFLLTLAILFSLIAGLSVSYQLYKSFNYSTLGQVFCYFSLVFYFSACLKEAI